jgi:hypothetical protein
LCRQSPPLPAFCLVVMSVDEARLRRFMLQRATHAERQLTLPHRRWTTCC